MSCADLDKITKIVKIEGTLVNETPLRIGYGKSKSFTEATDDPIIKRGEKPIIPGSTLKGAFRSFVESYAKSLGDKVCELSDDECKSCSDDSYCTPCILFGFKDIASRVYILDAIAREINISQRTMVAISRVFGGQIPKHLYTLDYVEPNSKFSFTMYVYNLDMINGENELWKKKSIEALKSLLKFLGKEGIFIGAKKSIGFGLVKLVNSNVTLYEAPDLITPKVTKKLEEVL